MPVIRQRANEPHCSSGRIAQPGKGIASGEIRLLAQALRSMEECVSITDSEDCILFVNSAFLRTYGYDERELLGRSIRIVRGADPRLEGGVEQILAGTLAGGWHGHLWNRRKNGTEFPISLSTAVVRDEAGAPVALIGVARDLTERLRAEEQLRQSERKYRNLYESMTDAFAQIDMSGRLQEFNQSFQRLLGYSREELLIRGCHDLTPPRWRELEARIVEQQVLARGYSEVYEKDLQKKDGTVFPVEMRLVLIRDEGGQPTGMWAIVRDISERKALEWELHQAQRLESVGQLAAGIAHEINTPIQYVGDNIRFLADAFNSHQAALQKYEELRKAAEAGAVSAPLLDQLRETLRDADWEYFSEEIPKAVAQSLDGVERVANIVRAMKEFAHPGRKEKAAADLNHALANVLIVARNALKYVADVETDYGDLPPVMCHINDLNQVFLNLLINAADAIRDVMKKTEKRGAIRVVTRAAPDRVTIRISDTGCGIPENIRCKVFDPFFTTKEVGRGSGQGLAIARSTVVEKHGGSISFEPNGEQGTTFIITLPLPAVSAGESDPSAAR